MRWMEIIHIRTHSYPDRDEALDTFRQLDAGVWPDKLTGLELLTSHAWEGDLSIVIHWSEGQDSEGKSPLGFQLAQAFSQFGQVNHSVWFQNIGLKIKGEEAS